MQTLFEAAKDAPDGTRFKFHSKPHAAALDECRKVVDDEGSFWSLLWGEGVQPVCHAFMDRTDFEIIRTGPWKPTHHNKGWIVDRCTGEVVRADMPLDNAALQSHKAAEHFGEMKRILIGLHNMPGACKGDEYAVCWLLSLSLFGVNNSVGEPHPFMSVPFDTAENAKNAADWANEELRK